MYFFYLKYVPLAGPFQTALVPVISLVFIATIIDRKKGLYLFVLFFPLINSLPYFFGISESISHAPTALVLFLFFFLGWAANAAFISKTSLRMDLDIYKPLALGASLVAVSSVMTLFRYANFFPFLSDAFYELKTNAIGVTAGGAAMSTVFFSLSYLTGFAFFIVILTTMEAKKDVLRLLSILCLSAFISFSIGIIQYFGKMNLGINPRIIGRGYVNATFKDSLSLGGFIALVFAVFLGMFLNAKKIKKVFYFILIGLSFPALLISGSRSGLLCVLAGIFFFILLSWGWRIKISKPRFFAFRNIAVLVLIAILVLFTLYFFSQMNIDNRYVKSLSTLKRLSIAEQIGLFTTLITTRNHLWRSGLLMMRDYPLTGVGTGAYIIELANYAKRHDISIMTPESAENDFIQVGAELGLIGLIVFVWLYWHILKRMKSQYSNIDDANKTHFITIAMICGIIAYFLNIQAHTYIGSYEIKYTFWLLVGMIFSLGKTAGSENQKYFRAESESSKPKVRWSKPFKVFSLALVFLFACVHLWNSTHSLSLKSRAELLGIKQDFGFYQLEKTDDGRHFRWTREYGGQTIKVEKPVIEIPLLASHPDIQEKPVKVKVYLVKELFKHRKLLGELVLNQGFWKTYAYEVPGEIGQELILLVKVNRTWNPLKTLGVPDPRNLGVAMGKIELKDKLNP